MSAPRRPGANRAATSSPPRTTLSVALDYARRGWAILPLHSGTKRPISELVPHGKIDATTDLDVITLWWRYRPEPLIAGVVPAGIVAIDIDPHNGGSLEALQAAGGCSIPETVTCWSGRQDGGRHLYFRAPLDQYRHRGLPTGIDLRVGTRHYCVLPPSRHPDTGKPYTWGPTTTVAPLPAGIQRLIEPQELGAPLRVTGITDRRVAGWLAAITEAPDHHNDVLFWSACRAAEAGIDLDAELTDAGLAVGLRPSAIRATLRSARRSA